MSKRHIEVSKVGFAPPGTLRTKLDLDTKTKGRLADRSFANLPFTQFKLDWLYIFHKVVCAKYRSSILTSLV